MWWEICAEEQKFEIGNVGGCKWKVGKTQAELVELHLGKCIGPKKKANHKHLKIVQVHGFWHGMKWKHQQ